MRKLTHDQVVERITKTHSGRIIVMGQYRGATKGIRVRCLNGHEWEAIADSIYRGNGCSECRFKVNAEKYKLTQAEAEARIFAQHGKSITVLGEYKNSHSGLLIECERGHRSSPRACHLFQGKGCYKCKGHYKRSHDEVVTRITSIHADKITVLGLYSGATESLEVSCRKCNHVWAPIADSLFRGQGCPKCAPYGFQPAKPAIVYYVRIASMDGPLFKIGITNRTVADRFEKDMRKITVLQIWNFKFGEDAYEFEQEVLRTHASDRYIGPRVLSGTGNKELFTRNILRIESEYLQVEIPF